MYTLILQGSVGFQQWNGDADLKFTNSCCGTSMLLYIPYVGWPLVMQVENVDDVAPATPGALRTRIHDVGKKGRIRKPLKCQKMIVGFCVNCIYLLKHLETEMIF